MWFEMRSRLPPSCGTQKLCSTSCVRRWKFTVRPVGRYSSFAVTSVSTRPFAPVDVYSG